MRRIAMRMFFGMVGLLIAAITAGVNDFFDTSLKVGDVVTLHTDYAAVVPVWTIELEVGIIRLPNETECTLLDAEPYASYVDDGHRYYYVACPTEVGTIKGSVQTNHVR